MPLPPHPQPHPPQPHGWLLLIHAPIAIPALKLTKDAATTSPVLGPLDHTCCGWYTGTNTTWGFAG